MKLQTEVPDKWEELIDIAVEIEGWERPAQYLRELIKKDLVSKGLLGKNGQIEETVLEEG
jgi:hypothetical protein